MENTINQLTEDTHLSNIISIRSRTNFAAVPNSFAQNPNISLQSKGLALYLQSLPEGWEVYPTWIRKQLGLSDWTWRKLSKELRKHGYLKLRSGGNEKGSFYTFDLWNTKDSLENPEMSKTNVSEKIPRRWKTPPGEKQQPYKETNKIKNKETTTAQQAVVVDEIMKMTSGLRISASQIKKWVSTYGDVYVIDKIQLMLESEPDSPERFLSSAIKFDWLPAPTPLPPTVQEKETPQMPHFTHDENATWFESRPEEVKKEIYNNALTRDWRIKCHFDRANVRVVDEGFSNHWLFDYLMEQINRSQRQSLQDELSRESSNSLR